MQDNTDLKATRSVCHALRRLCENQYDTQSETRAVTPACSKRLLNRIPYIFPKGQAWFGSPQQHAKIPNFKQQKQVSKSSFSRTFKLKPIARV